MSRSVDNSEATFVRVSTADERRAREIIAIHDDKDYSLTDATRFAVMGRLRIGAAFTFDRHFARYGFAVIGPYKHHWRGGRDLCPASAPMMLNRN